MKVLVRALATSALLTMTVVGAGGGHAYGSNRLPAVTRASSKLLQKPVFAFYYLWYHHNTWCSCTMSDLPKQLYDSSDNATIMRQIKEAGNAGITAFIASWPGAGSTQDMNLAKLLADEATYQQQTGKVVRTSIYLETDQPGVGSNLKAALHYLIAHYVNNPYFFRWHGKPVIFVWNPVGNGRTLNTWTRLRAQVDPGHHLIWSAEGTDTNLLNVFDGLHLFSAAYWGLQQGDIGAVDQSFRQRISAYNAVHHSHKIWAAGVEPGYDDTRVPGRTGTYRVPRRDGATYHQSWSGAIGSSPDWITITSFNEWFEGAMIEPSRHYGNKYLKLTKQYATYWRSH